MFLLPAQHMTRVGMGLPPRIIYPHMMGVGGSPPSSEGEDSSSPSSTGAGNYRAPGVYPRGRSPRLASAPPTLSGYSAPKAPRYAGFSVSERRVFALKYTEYMRECAEAGLSLGVRIGVRSIGSCIEARAKLFAASMHFGKGVGEVTHKEWVSYFQYALDYHSSDYGDLVEKIKTSVIMDENDLDVDSCFDKWVFAYWGLLERNHMMSFHEKHPKIAVEAFTHGLRPAPLRRLIQSHFKLDHKQLRNSVLQFFDFEGLPFCTFS